MLARFLFTWCAVLRRGTQLRAFLVYMAKLSLNFGRAPDPPGIEEMCPSWFHGAMAGSCRLLYDVHQAFFPFWSLCSDSPTSSQPQPLGSVGDDTLCEDTREDVGLSV